MAFPPIAILRNHPKVQASDSCVEGITSSAIFRPGEKREITHPGAAASFGTAQASARKPVSKPSTAGKTQRKNGDFGIRTDCIKGLPASAVLARKVCLAWRERRAFCTLKRFPSFRHYACSKAHPNSNASVLTNGGTVVQVPVLGVIGRETRGGALPGELCSPRVRRCIQARV